MFDYTRTFGDNIRILRHCRQEVQYKMSKRYDNE